MTAGIYRLRNQETNFIYVGSSSICIFDRMKSHVRELRKNKHKNPRLQRSWNAHSETVFVFEIVEIISGSFFLPEIMALHVERREQRYIDAVPASFRYNLCPAAGSRFGATMPEDARKRIGAAFRGKPLSIAHKTKLQVSNKGQGAGRKLPPEVCLKMSATRTGHKLSKDHCERISDARLGIVFSDKHRASLSAAQKRRFAREELESRTETKT